MPASQPHPPPPQPLPPPPLSLPSPSSSTVPRRRHRRLASSSSSSTSSSSPCNASTASIFSPSPSPSPARTSRAAATATTTASVVVPFSWELHPGIPKSCLASSAGAGAASDEPLPLPPPLRASPRHRRQHRRRRSDGGVPAVASSTGSGTSDPFTAAFAECTREEEDGATGNFGTAAAPTPVVPGRRRSDASSEHRWWLTGGSGFVGFLDLYGCKSAMAVADAAILARRRPVVRTKQGRATRRDK
ncbi:hypothetical protein E2562_014238 [Oryza meyeriana var. granulata]|uniref:Uncharacterized protein n=1 Tax=Oryza meyeriana var. granulata TaxID=110450 RepID=A0A6G1BKN0_9ORYZ|nr:hypothetical protein E2562_014238 [Oryza meyeriana var. granulata]